MDSATAFVAGVATGYTMGYLAAKKEGGQEQRQEQEQLRTRIIFEIEGEEEEQRQEQEQLRTRIIFEIEGEEEEEEEEEIIPIRKVKVIKESYTADEVAELTDHKLLSEYSRITERNIFYCSHCKKYTELTNWVYVIRKLCEKKGLNKNLPVRKTCDKQTMKNDRCNPVNNKAYPMLRASNITKSQKHSVQELRSHGLRSVGVTTEPYRYVFS